MLFVVVVIFFFKQKTAYEMRISDWSSDVCSSDLADLDLLGAAQIVDRGLFELQADFLGNHGATGEDGHVFEHRLAPIAEARCLDRAHLDDATDGVDHRSAERRVGTEGVSKCRSWGSQDR